MTLPRFALTPKEAGETLGFKSDSVIRKLVRERRLVAITLTPGGDLLIPVSELERLIAETTTEARRQVDLDRERFQFMNGSASKLPRRSTARTTKEARQTG